MREPAAVERVRASREGDVCRAACRCDSRSRASESDGYFAAPTGLRSNFPLLSMKSRHSDALSQAEMCL
jgi:hypothetical protein